MRENMKRVLFALCSLLLMALAVSAQEPCPEVIPALQQWKGGRGKIVLPAQGRIVVSTADEARLSSAARILADDLKDMMGWNYTVAVGKPKRNDIVFSLSKPDEQLGDEGYTMSIGNTVSIAAPTAKGVFWGTRSLLQILYNKKGELPKGEVRDFPSFPNRGFMLDVARKFFTMDYLKQYVKILSFYKMN